jgi:uncharacterized protein (DUF697 family)
MTKTMIAPIVAVIALAIKGFFGIEIPETVQAEIVTYLVGAIALGTTVWGIVKNHKKEGEK